MDENIKFFFGFLGFIIFFCIYHMMPMIIETEKERRRTNKIKKIVFGGQNNYNNIVQYFIRVLKEENILNDFVEEFNSPNGIKTRKQNNYPIKLNDFISYMLLVNGKPSLFYQCINNSFIWKNSKKGFEFWRFKAYYLSENYDSKLREIDFKK